VQGEGKQPIRFELRLVFGCRVARLLPLLSLSKVTQGILLGVGFEGESPTQEVAGQASSSRVRDSSMAPHNVPSEGTQPFGIGL
jgi:hypothetical protein